MMTPVGPSPIGIEAIDHRHAGREVEFEDLFLGQAVEDHDKRAQRIAVGGDQHLLALQHQRQDLGEVIGPDAGAGVAQAFAAGRRNVVGPAPDMHLLLAPLLAGIVLVETGEIAVVALVQRLVADRLQVRLADLVEDDLAGILRALQVRGKGDVEGDAVIGQRLAAGIGFADTEFGQFRVFPAREQVLQVPVALAVADEDEGAGHVVPPDY